MVLFCLLLVPLGLGLAGLLLGKGRVTWKEFAVVGGLLLAASVQFFVARRRGTAVPAPATEG